jgi:hypothetical protein
LIIYIKIWGKNQRYEMDKDWAKVTTVYMPFSEKMIKKHFADVKEAVGMRGDHPNKLKR